MNSALIKHLYRSPEVRRVVVKEVARLLFVALLSIGAVALARALLDKPVLEGVLSAALGAAALSCAWLVSAIRTLRAVLREEGLLKR